MDAVYKITNTVNDKVYIGYSSRGATDRWYQHCANAFKKSKRSRLYSAMRKYGQESFVVESIYEGKDALHKENDYIVEYNSKENGYNMTDGGEANRLGIPNSEEQKAKISASLKGRKKSPETRAAMKTAWVIRRRDK
jgi:group I intron endonuclease